VTADILSTKDLQKMGPIFGHPSFDNHEQVVFCQDETTGLKAIISVHSTVLGPSLGGTRMWQYESEWAALNDALRLSRGMTYKAAISGLDQGGGKAVIIGDSKTMKNDKLMRKFAEFVHNLGGTYLTAEDMGMDTRDMDVMRDVTPYVTGISESLGGSGNPSPITALGVYMGMKGATKYQFGTDSLQGKKILVQGVGHVGEVLIQHLVKEGADIIIHDINKEAVDRISKTYQTKIHQGDALYGLDVDIYAPCAMGATLNDNTINQLKAKVIAGAANNQLEDELRHGDMLKQKGIAYAPDFLVNAGGIINIYQEVGHFTKDDVIRQTENIYHTTIEILKSAEENRISTHQAAYNKAQARIDAKRKSNQ